jgi:hypothetical protein
MLQYSCLWIWAENKAAKPPGSGEKTTQSIFLSLNLTPSSRISRGCAHLCPTPWDWEATRLPRTQHVRWLAVHSWGTNAPAKLHSPAHHCSVREQRNIATPIWRARRSQSTGVVRLNHIAPPMPPKPIQYADKWSDKWKGSTLNTIWNWIWATLHL